MNKLRAGTIVLLIAAVVSVTLRGRSVQDARPASPLPHVYQLGNVRVDIPPPRGFEEMLSRSAEFRQRIGEPERLWNLAAHLPSETARTFKPDQDIPLYTKVSVSRAAVETDITDEFFAGVVKQTSDSTV